MVNEVIRDPQSNRDFTINGNFIGGLNTEANALNIPHTDTPLLENVDMVGGSVFKRTGTRRRIELPNENCGISSVKLVSDQRVNLTILKNGNSINVGHVNNLGVSTYTNVWNSTTPSGRPNFIDIPTPEGVSKLILCPSAIPVQVFFYEQSWVQNSSVNGGTWEPDARFNFANESRLLHVFITSTGQIGIEQISGANINVGSRTFTLTTPTPSNTVKTILVNVVWQWWCQAYWYLGNRFYQQTQRFGVDSKDRHVPIPDTLRDGFDYATRHRDIFPNNRYPLEVHQRIDPTNRGVYTRSNNPSNASQWTITNGTSGVLTTNPVTTETLDGKTHVTFGGTSLAGLDTTPEGSSPVHLHRLRQLLFDNGRPFLPAQVRVSIGYKTTIVATTPNYGTGVNRAVSTTPATGTELGFTLIGTDGLNIGSNIARIGWGIGFVVGGTASTGVPPNQIIRIAYLFGAAFRGSSTTTEIQPYRPGYAMPIYGLGEFADYAAGQFPSTAVLVNGRLFLSGCASDPMRVLVSSVEDYNLPGEYFTDFQIDAFTQVQGAYDFRVASVSPGDFITNLIESGDLFVYSRNSVQRVKLDEQFRVIGVGVVANIGPTNNLACTSVDGRMIFISDSGLFECRPAEGLGDAFTVVSLSNKVARLFRNNNSLFQTLAYDATKRQLYICLSEGVNLVYHLDFGAFSRWSSYHSTTLLYGETVGVMENSTRLQFFMITQSSNLPNSINTLGQGIWLLQTSQDRYLDLTGIDVPPGAGLSVTEAVPPGQQTFDISPLPQLRVNNIDDIRIQDLDTGDYLIFGNDYIKRGNQIILNRVYPTTKNYMATPRYGGYTSMFGSNGTLYGWSYPTVVGSPPMNFQNMHRYKRLLHTELLLDNSVRGNLSNVDTGSSNQVRWLRPPNVNVSVLYDSGLNSTTELETYYPDELVWDTSLFDDYQSSLADGNNVLLRLPIQGVSYVFQLILWNFSQNPFGWAGYQMVAKIKGNRYQK